MKSKSGQLKDLLSFLVEERILVNLYPINSIFEPNSLATESDRYSTLLIEGSILDSYT